MYNIKKKFLLEKKMYVAFDVFMHEIKYEKIILAYIKVCA